MCGLEFPDLETSFWQPLRDRGVTVVGIDTGGLSGGDTEAQVSRFVAQTGVTFPVGWELTESYRAYDTAGAISPFPLDVVIDRDGRIAYVSREYDATALRATVDGLLAR